MPCPHLHRVAVVLVAATAGASLGQSIVIDNVDPGFSDPTGTWLPITAAGQFGSSHLYRYTIGTPSAVEWRPTIDQAGFYEVAIWYVNGNDRPNNAPYTVHHANGVDAFAVDQRVNGAQWNVLGTFSFVAGTAGFVALSSDGAQANKSIIADAVRFRRVGGSEDEGAPEVRACWLTQYWYLGKTEAQLRAAAQNMKAGGMNTVYIAMYTGGTVYWPSRAYKAAGGNWGSGSTDYAAYLVPIFKGEGLKVGAWFEYGLALGGATHPIAVSHPDWLARDINNDPVTGENGGFVFMSPGHPAARQLMADMARELAADYNFDDIQLDRFRWGRKTTGREYGYEQVTRDLYVQTYGVQPPTNVNNATWVTFRENLVNQTMQGAYSAVKAVNPKIVVSSAPLGSYGITQHMQRWSSWVNGGYMDLVMPQMYMTSYNSFMTEFNTQKTQAPAHLDKLGVGYRAQETTDAALVSQQLAYARSQGVPHGCLWVYHNYTTQVAIQDEINLLPQAGQPWAAPAYNPFVSDRMLQLIVDNRDTPTLYLETGTWSNSATADFFRFDSRVIAGGSAATAAFRFGIPKPGRYDVHVWYTQSSNRNDAAQYVVTHHHGVSTVIVDQRSGGGQWVNIGSFVFDAGALAPRVTLSSSGSSASEFTSSDAVKLVLSGYALGDADGDSAVTRTDFALSQSCWTGPDGGPLGEPCEAFDFDDDGDADMLDFAAMQARAVEQ